MQSVKNATYTCGSLDMQGLRNGEHV